MKWNIINSVEQLNIIDQDSNSQPVFILKHSTTCSISRMALNRIESSWKDEYSSIAKPFFLDLLSYRSVSNEIESRYGIIHESPQILVIVKGKCIFNESHSGIRLAEILEHSKN